jgi:hypothetical protein
VHTPGQTDTPGAASPVTTEIWSLILCLIL